MPTKVRDAIAGSTSAPPQRLRIHAPAKINLALRILAREDTGFHQIETLFVSLEEGDTVALSRTARGVALSTEGPAPCPTEENLAYRAAREFLERSGGEGGVEIRLVKRLPTRAGIGEDPPTPRPPSGGSSASSPADFPPNSC